MMVAVENELDPFVEHRGLLFTVAYEMLGSVADAGGRARRTAGCAGPTSTSLRCASRAPTWSGSSPARR